MEGASPNVSVFGCQTRTIDNPLGACYGPDQIQTAYGIKPLLANDFDGTGRTIVIVDAFQSPTIQQDLALFDTAFGLPAPTLNIIAPDGLTPFDPNDANQVGWSAEISLDVQWAHAVAPGATIDLVLAKSNNDADILSATKYAHTTTTSATCSRRVSARRSSAWTRVSCRSSTSSSTRWSRRAGHCSPRPATRARISRRVTAPHSSRRRARQPATQTSRASAARSCGRHRSSSRAARPRSPTRAASTKRDNLERGPDVGGRRQHLGDLQAPGLPGTRGQGLESAGPSRRRVQRGRQRRRDRVLGRPLRARSGVPLRRH